MARKMPKGWRMSELSDLVTITSGGTPARSQARYWGGAHPWVSAKDMKSFDLRDSEERLTEEGLAQASVAEPGDILILVRGMGLFKDVPIGIARKPMAFNQDVKALRVKSEINSRFIAYALVAKRHELMGRVDRAGHGTGRLPTNVIEGVPLLLPSVDEQGRIVAVLDAWSRAVEFAEHAQVQLEARRAAVVRKLVLGNAEQSAFRIMHKGRAPRGWKKFKIGQVAEEVSRVNRVGDDLPVLSCTKSQGIVYSQEYFGKQVYSKDTSTYKRVRRGEFVYATNHIEEGSIGLQAICKEGLVSPMYTVFHVDESQVLPGFLIALLKTETYRQIFSASTSASVDRRGSLRWKEFSKLPVRLPDLAEQARVVKAIASINSEVLASERRVEALRTQKRGLMQLLLSGEKSLLRDLPGMELVS